MEGRHRPPNACWRHGTRGAKHRNPHDWEDITREYTIAEALHAMRRLSGVDAGRLRGVELRYDLDRITGLDILPPPWGAHLAGLVEARKAEHVSAETPQYLVF